MLHLSPLVYAATIGSDLVLLDVSADRYLALPGAVSAEGDATCVTVHPAMSVLDEAAQVLLEAGLLSRQPGRVVEELPPPAAALPQTDPDSEVRPRFADVIHLAISLVRGAWRFRSGTPLRGYASTRRPSGVLPDGYLTLSVERYRAIKLFVPTPRRCLPDAVIGALFLRRLGIEVEVVFGVRSHPFEAHCWLERDGVVLDDHLERVSGYVPIATAVL